MIGFGTVSKVGRMRRVSEVRERERRRETERERVKRREKFLKKNIPLGKYRSYYNEVYQKKISKKTYVP